MERPKLSIIIITLNEEQRLPRLLGDLARQGRQDFEILHVDSQSDDGTVAVSKTMAPRFASYRIIEMDGRGVSRGRNTGAAAACAERLLFLDADTRLAPDFLENAMAELDTGGCDLGIVQMSAEGLPPQYRLGYGAFNLGIRLTARVFPTAIGACLFSTRRLHDRIGGFDTRLSLCEDCNYALKAFRCNAARLAVLKTRFAFDPRRLQQDGFAATGLTYLRANLRRFVRGELYHQEIPYSFGHYS
ncbi:MAG: glycosyltransferase [Silicimonas sp.]|nr:glycosyltransferase [Silicimonas sp.]